jgi:hypothetical protein
VSGIEAPDTGKALEILEGPERVGSELRWRARLEDGRPVLLAMLVPELSGDESIRRRYVRDVERLAKLGAPGLCTVLATGPSPNSRDPKAPPPWRLRLEPEAEAQGPTETLEAWISRCAPAPLDEVARRVEAVARVVHGVHGKGAVLRDLNPRWISMDASGSQVWLTDVGLARVDILSTRTAASLVLEGSPYASPEQLRRTIVDQRSDLFGLGVILFHAIAGTLPFGDGPSILRDTSQVASLGRVRADCPPEIDDLVARCLADEPGKRPESVEELISVLRGEQASHASHATAPCQNCGSAMRPGQRLCLACGRLAVQFRYVRPGDSVAYAVDLKKATEDGEFTRRLAGVLAPVVEGPLPSFNFIIGDQRMYSKEERQRRIALPARLFSGMTEDSANLLAERMRAAGLDARLVGQDGRTGQLRRRAKIGLGVAAGVAALVALLAGAAAGVGAGLILGLSAVVVVFIIYAAMKAQAKKVHARPTLLRLRQQTAALPASDPLVARLAALMTPELAPDLRDQVGELALQVQRLVDHRARNLGEAQEIDLVSEPVSDLVTLIEQAIETLGSIDRGLSELDEGTLVRALASSEARGESPEHRRSTLEGLDRLRELEQRRAQVFHRLLEASRLMRRSIDLALGVRDPEALHALEVNKALAVLEGENPAREEAGS